jgi:hypothetical protein
MMDGKQRGNPDDTAEERDLALNSLLREWQAPVISRALDRQILADYHKALRPESFWRRFFSASVRVPLPVAVAVLILLFLAAAAVLRYEPAGKTALPAVAGSGTIQAAHTEPPVIIHTNLSGFQPVSDLNVTVIGEDRK